MSAAGCVRRTAGVTPERLVAVHGGKLVSVLAYHSLLNQVCGTVVKIEQRQPLIYVRRCRRVQLAERNPPAKLLLLIKRHLG